MPLPKAPPPAEQLWKKSEKKAQRLGLHKTVYEVNGDKFTGEWHSDVRHGKGTCVYKNGSVFNGDWHSGKRHGYGVRSVMREGELCKEYSGGWSNGKKEGFGANFYKTGDRYEGEWFEGKRSGWGRMLYSDGSQYEGEWLADERSGLGLLVLANGNRYEGYWENDAKHGDGKFFYLDKGQLLSGTWVNGTGKCGEFIDLQRQNAAEPTQFPLPELGLFDARAVLAAAKLEHFGAEAEE